MKSVETTRQRRVIMAAVLLAIAFLCGHLMQSTETKPSRSALFDPEMLPDAPSETGAVVSLQPAVLPGRTRERHRYTASAVEPVVPIECAPSLSLRARAGAMIEALVETCSAGGDVELRYSGLNFDFISDADGRLRMDIPAFEVESLITVIFENMVLQSTAVQPEAEGYQRVALHWEGDQVLNMHAFEFGARTNNEGHIWSGAPADRVRAIQGQGGFLTSLGNGSGRTAEVYSFPAAKVRGTGVVRLVVKAHVTSDVCDRDIEAVALQNGPLEGLSETKVALKMPPCEQVGATVQLQNLFQDMRLAQR